MSCPTINELPPAKGRNGWPWTEGCEPLSEEKADGESWPRISIVTPSFNQGRFIEETIRSVLLQGYPNLEYIIMDGGSTDSTADIIKKYKPWLAHSASEPDDGQADAINKGWSMADGEILAWLNSDDVYAPKAFQMVAGEWCRAGRPGMVYGDAFATDITLSPFKKKKMAGYSLLEMLRGKRMPQPSVFIAKEFFNKLGPLKESLYYSLDFDYFLRAWMEPAASDFIYLPHVLSYSREYAETKCATGGWKKADADADVLRSEWNERMRHYHSFREWRCAFAAGLCVMAKRHIYSGRFAKAMRLYTEALTWSLRIFPNIAKTIYFYLTRNFHSKS